MKRNYSHVNSLSALYAEKRAVRNMYIQQEDQLKMDVKSYIHGFSPSALFHKYINKSRLNNIDDKLNISGKLMSLVLPFFLNKTLFRGSGFITKAVVGLISNKLGNKLDLDHITGIVDTVKGWFTKKIKSITAKEKGFVDYGIPPDSETY